MFQKFWRCYCVIEEMLEARGYFNDIEGGECECEGEGECEGECEAQGNKFQKSENERTMVSENERTIASENVFPGNEKYEKFEKRIKAYCQENETSDEINQQVLDKLSYLWQHRYTGEWIYVFFVSEKIGVNLINSYVALMDEGGVNRAVLVSVPQHKYGNQAILTPFAEKELERLYVMDAKIIEHFYMDDLTVNILKHDLQPKEIRVLTNEEKNQIIERHQTPIHSFPRILMYDPLARFLGLRPQDMISCLCHSETNGEYIRYRVCTY